MQRLHLILTWLTSRLRNVPQRARLAALLAVLLLIGAGAVIAAPHPSQTANTHALVQFGDDPATDTPSETATASVSVDATATATEPNGLDPTATDTPDGSDPQSPTAIPTTPSDTPTPDSPTATPTEPPTPTPTEGPSWHTVGTYSGDDLETVTMLHHVTGPVRVLWTCSVPDGLASWHFGVYVRSVSNGAQVGQGVLCGPDGTSGTFSYNPQYLDMGGDFRISVDQAAHADVGPWTLTVQEWY